MILTQHDISILAQEEKYRDQIIVIRKIATAKGFYDYYFAIIPEFSTRIEAFNYVNELYFELFGEYKYSSYQNFLKVNRVRNENR